jgi:hypothetical protein
MKKLAEIKGAHINLFRIFDKICFNKFVTGGERINLSYFDGNTVQLIEPGLFYAGVQVGNSCMWQPLNGKGLKVWDKDFNIIREEDWEIYFASVEQFFEDKFIAVQVEDGISGTYIFSEDLSRKKTVDHLIVAKAGGNFITVKPGLLGAEAYGIENPEMKWGVDVSVFESPKRFDKHGRDRGINKVEAGSGPCGTDTTVFLPLKYGQLLALNAVDGSFKWMKDYGGYTASFDNRVYHLNGPELQEIDPESGDILRTVEFRKHIDKPGFVMSQPFEAYDDIILLQGHQSVVALVDRKTFELIDWFQPSGWESTRIPSSLGVMHWCNNRVYVVDMDEVLHIYERE